MTKCAILLEEIGVTNSCREYIRPGDEFQSDPKGVRRDNTRIGPVLDVLVTTNLAVTEVRLNIDALATDGSTSWVFIICNGALDGMQEPMYVDSVTYGTGKPVAFMQRRAKLISLISGKNQHILIEQGIGSIFLVWTECCHTVSQSREE